MPAPQVRVLPGLLGSGSLGGKAALTIHNYAINSDCCVSNPAEMGNSPVVQTRQPH